MKREDLEKIEGLSKEAIDKIMALHGQDIEGHKTKLGALQTELDGVKTQLVEAGKQIESFKSMDIEGVKKSADEWKTKAEEAERNAQTELAKLKFDHALDGALTGAKAKNAKAVRALLDTELLKFNDADGSIIGLEDQLKKIKESNDFLFEGEKSDPKIVTGGIVPILEGRLRWY
ncbi:MAG: phage scaffolding protein [Anaerolineaceae bacterium]|nr:phage scaffolding protein [Anaerolineaceae bacterium]